MSVTTITPIRLTVSAGRAEIVSVECANFQEAWVMLRRLLLSVFRVRVEDLAAECEKVSKIVEYPTLVYIYGKGPLLLHVHRPLKGSVTWN